MVTSLAALYCTAVMQRPAVESYAGTPGIVWGAPTPPGATGTLPVVGHCAAWDACPENTLLAPTVVSVGSLLS